MSGFASARQLTERQLIPGMLAVIVSAMKRHSEIEGEDELSVLGQVEKLLTEAMREPLLGLPSDKASKIIRRTMRVTEAAMKPYFSLQLGVQYLIIAYWTRSLVERDVVQVGSESVFGKAWDLMANTMALAWDDLEQLEDLAIRGARELGESLEAQGYFR